MTHKHAVLRLLSDRQPHTHHELYALGCVAHSRISDLRKDGYTISQWREGDHYLYRLVGSLDEASVTPLALASSSVPSNLTAKSEVVPEDKASQDGDTLLLFECEVDESAGLRGAYGDAA